MEKYEKIRKIKDWKHVTVIVLIISISLMTFTACESNSSTNNTSATTVEGQESENEFKVLNKKERRAIYDEYGFNNDGTSGTVELISSFDLNTTEDIDLNKPVYFDLPYDENCDHSYEDNHLEKSLYNIYTPGEMFDETIRVEAGFIVRCGLTQDEMNEMYDTLSFKTKKGNGYILSNDGFTASYYIYLQSEDINNNEPFVVCHVYYDGMGQEEEIKEKMSKLSDAITSQIIESIEF